MEKSNESLYFDFFRIATDANVQLTESVGSAHATLVHQLLRRFQLMHLDILAHPMNSLWIIAIVAHATHPVLWLGAR